MTAPTFSRGTEARCLSSVRDRQQASVHAGRRPSPDRREPKGVARPDDKGAVRDANSKYRAGDFLAGDQRETSKSGATQLHQRSGIKRARHRER